MMTIKQESVLLKKIKSLTELEFSALLKEMSDHIYKNHWSHIIDECFDIDNHKEELEDLQRDFDTAVNMLDDLEIIDDDLQKEIDKIKDVLG